MRRNCWETFQTLTRATYYVAVGGMAILIGITDSKSGVGDCSTFSQATLHGLEVGLLTFYILLYNLVDINLNNAPAALVVTYLAELLIRFVRLHFGLSNTAWKTLLDRRFLI
jgi:hypothetical protein